MDPNQNPNQPPYPPTPGGADGQQPQYSIDYLNQIAPAPQKPGLSNKMFLVLAGGGLLIALIFGGLVLSGGLGGGGPKTAMQTYAARLEMLRTIAEDSQKKIKAGTLRSTNSNLNILLANAIRDMEEPLAVNGIDVKKLDKDIVAAESGEELSQKLEDARLNAVFDHTYAREMAYQLDALAGLMKEIYEKVNSKSLKEYLEETNSNLQPIKQQFYDFNATTS